MPAERSPSPFCSSAQGWPQPVVCLHSTPSSCPPSLLFLQASWQQLPSEAVSLEYHPVERACGRDGISDQNMSLAGNPLFGIQAV